MIPRYSKVHGTWLVSNHAGYAMEGTANFKPDYFFSIPSISLADP